MVFNKLIAFLTAIFSVNLYADVSMYSGNRSIFAREQHYLMLHHHSFNMDGSDARRVVSYVEVLDLSQSGKTIFKINSPLFTHIFISKDGNYFVGISNIKATDNPQLVLYSKSGAELKSWSFSCRDLSYNNFCAESLYNYIQWFNESDPYFSIKEDGKVIISVDDNEFF